MPYLLLFLILIFPNLQRGLSAPPLVLPINPYYQDEYGLFGGLSYSYDDDLMLDSMTASASMNVLKKTEAAMENLRRLTDPLLLVKLSAPGGMQRNLLLTLYWLAEADMAGADVEQVLQELSRRGRDQATPADATMAEVLLFNYHTARHLGILDFASLEKLGQGLPPSIPESDNNPLNRLAFPVPILPPERFPQVAHQLFNYELFDGPLPKATSTTLAPSQIEFAQKLISRGLLPPNALQAAP
ncbi:MAG: hypothetical protein EBT30_04585 [Verrucomicrobia bacterium]|nr:hypothetical protein [Verrucomicrobiota bacterium]